MAAAKKKTSKASAPKAMRTARPAPVVAKAKPKAASAKTGTAQSQKAYLLAYIFAMLCILFLAMAYYNYT